MSRLSFIIILASLIVACGPKVLEPDAAFECSNCERWNTPQDPFRVYGNTWYVGTAGLSSILIETADGLILIDGGLPQSAALIDASIRKLGFDPLQISAILLSHAHFDHAGGIAALQRLSGATVYTSDAGQLVLESGELQADDPQYMKGATDSGVPAVSNVVSIGDREKVTIGGFDVLFRMFNNNLKLCLLLLLLLSLLLSYSVAVVIYILYYKQGPAKTELPSPGAQQHRSWTSTHMQPSAISQTLAHECLQQTSLPSM